MLKREVRKLVNDRAVTKYPKSVTRILEKIIDLIELEDWKSDHIDGRYSRPTNVSKMEFLSRYEWHTVKRALKTLTEDGVITRNPKHQDSYRVNPEVLEAMPSKFLADRNRHVERKVMTAVRMRMLRREDNAIVQKVLGNCNGTVKVQQFAELHPEPALEGALTCVCTRPFCSHPSAI